MILHVGPDSAADDARGRAANPGATGVVARPELFDRLGGPARVTVVSAPAGSGKTMLLRSWIGRCGLGECAAWATARQDEGDPQQFWVSVLDALRRTAPGAALVQALTAAPDLDGWVIVERLLKDLAPLRDPLWMVVDDAHELGAEALRQLQLLVLRAPPRLRFVLATRHDVRLGLHRLRLEGELTEIRAADLRFTVAQAREMFEAAGVKLSESALATLHERTEGWAAGLRLAALSLAGHPDPERFAAGFCGGERTVAEYLLAEVLERQDARVRRLLLRTSMLERVNGELADVLTGGSGSEGMLQDLERANAFVVALDAGRTWFRYHQMFADLLQLELRREAPEELVALHRAGSGWFAEHGYPAEAIRHAQAARDWRCAAGSLADAWPALFLDGRSATVHDLLAGFPAEVRAADAELAALVAADELAHGSPEAAERHLGAAEHAAASVPEIRCGPARMLLGIVRLLVARRRGDQKVVTAEARQLKSVADVCDTARPGLSEDLHALALISVGITEDWTNRLDEAEQLLVRGTALARRIGRPYLEYTGLAYLAAAGLARSAYAQAHEYAEQVVALAERHGWTDEPPASIAYAVLGAALVWRGRAEEAEPWVQRAERVLTVEAEPAVGAGLRYLRGVLELVRGRDAEALAAFRAAEPLTAQLHLDTPHYLSTPTQALMLHALVRQGETELVERILAGLGEQGREQAEVRVATAALRLAQGDPQGAVGALAPVLDGSVPLSRRTWPVTAYVLEAAARDALADPAAAGRALERALDLAEPDAALWHFLLHPVPDLLKRRVRHSSHAALIADILSLLAGRRPAAPSTGPLPAPAALSESEIRVLRYLPTNLTAPEIARDLGISPNTVKTHIRNLYAKLGTHSRSEAVAHARDLGLLAPGASSASSPVITPIG